MTKRRRREAKRSRLKAYLKHPSHEEEARELLKYTRTPPTHDRRGEEGKSSHSIALCSTPITIGYVGVTCDRQYGTVIDGPQTANRCHKKIFVNTKPFSRSNLHTQDNGQTPAVTRAQTWTQRAQANLLVKADDCYVRTVAYCLTCTHRARRTRPRGARCP